jgi:biopolymer transport protein ExbD
MKDKFGSAGADEHTHGDKPWVYFMIDCFFLLTAFTVLSFNSKVEERVLLNKLPPAGGPGPIPFQIRTTEPLNVQVAAGSNEQRYLVQGNEITQPQLQSCLFTLAEARHEDAEVKISYDAETSWGDVISVFNACTKAQIKKCGLKQLRGR